ncbi:YndJ family protein [Virgibacillus sp. DJP39]|uniref:YndJ family protein n=1 Tax=Virgibacillus sp. DJP39 TaxID=3409790 RepID=UPI003BB7CF59
MTFFKIAIINVLFFIMITLFSPNQWHFLILTVAQLVFVPIVLHIVTVNNRNWFTRFVPYIFIPPSLGIVFLQLIPTNMLLNGAFAGLYFVFTIIVAYYGFFRFMNRGFVNLEEFMIDMGLIYLAIGGAWFFASETNVNTGFSPILTWLTSIHFHYASFLLPVFVGFLGRLYKSTLYKWICTLILIAPIIVAVGITYSVVLELISVLIYIVAIYGLIILSYKAKFSNTIQKRMVRISFAALGLSILFSLMYAFGNLTGLYSVTITFMLYFHGITNCLLFALVGVIGWNIKPPCSNEREMDFPVSKIKGKMTVGEAVLSEKLDDPQRNGLVDDMEIYKTSIDSETHSSSVVDFYENTRNYRLFAEVNWHNWFKPFAYVYKLLSRNVKQINLPLSSKKVEMIGDILSVKEGIDGRTSPRAWVRKANGETVFIAVYSYHKTGNRTYMNIALPLPWSTMTGILELNWNERKLELTSKRKQPGDSDSGVYFTLKNFLFKLPIEERFRVGEDVDGNLEAQHVMWIFSIPFLTINYTICQKSR